MQWTKPCDPLYIMRPLYPLQIDEGARYIEIMMPHTHHYFFHRFSTSHEPPSISQLAGTCIGHDAEERARRVKVDGTRQMYEDECAKNSGEEGEGEEAE